MNLNSKDVALTGVFAALYAVLSFMPLFPVVGAPGKFFSLTLIIAPLFGLIIGPYRGALAASIGGFTVYAITQNGPLFQFSFVPGAATALCAGYLYKDKWRTFVLIYSALFLAYGFYPAIGPMWLYPYYIWFHILGLIVLVSQAILGAVHKPTRHGLMELGFGVGVISLIATLFGHLVGGLMFETIYFSTYSVDAWRGLWHSLIFVYPLERSLVVLVSVLVGAPLIKSLKNHGFEIGGK